MHNWITATLAVALIISIWRNHRRQCATHAHPHQPERAPAEAPQQVAPTTPTTEPSEAAIQLAAAFIAWGVIDGYRSQDGTPRPSEPTDPDPLEELNRLAASMDDAELSAAQAGPADQELIRRLVLMIAAEMHVEPIDVWRLVALNIDTDLTVDNTHPAGGIPNN